MRPRVLLVLTFGGVGLFLVLITSVVGVRGMSGPADEPARVDRRPVPRVTARQVDVVIRPGRRNPPLDRLPDQGTRLVRVRHAEPVVVGQCVVDGPCAPGTPAPGLEGSAVALVELRRRIAGVQTGRFIATIPLVFGRAASVVPTTVPVTPLPSPVVHPDLPTDRVVVGLALAATLGALALWLLRPRPDERPEDPFWGVELDVPEWEGVSIEIDEDALAAQP